MSKLYTDIGEFQAVFRDYAIERLTRHGIDAHAGSYDSPRRPGQQLEFRDLKQLVVRNKEAFRDDFGSKVHNLPTWLDDLREIRNKVAHFAELTSEDENEAYIIIRKISAFAGLNPAPTALVEGMKNPSAVEANQSRRMSDPGLDSILKKLPILSNYPKAGEYKVRRHDLGIGSIWIAKQKAGYRIVTTGSAHAIDAELERITGQKPITWPDRYHHGWRELDQETVRLVLTYYANL